LLNSKSIWDTLGDNPCNSQIFNTPLPSKEGSAQINFYCSSGQKSLNTLSLVVLKNEKTLKNAIKETARINAFNSDQIFKSGSNWNCFIDENEIFSFNIPINNGNIINCYQNK
jgi:hypothetical protein